MDTAADPMWVGPDPATVSERIDRLERQIAALTGHLMSPPAPDSAADAILQRLDQIGEVLMLLAASSDRQNAIQTAVLSLLQSRE